MTRLFALAFGFVLALAPATAAWGGGAAAGYDPEPWMRDFDQMKEVLAERAPNLDWSVAARGLDLPALSREIEEDLRLAGSDTAARAVLRDFIGRFGDGHISLEFPDEKADASLPWGTASICKGLGYEDEERPAGLPFDRIGGRSIAAEDSAVFPITVLDLPGGRLGVLRIPSFYEWGYYQFCPQAVALVGLPEDGECGPECGAAIGQKAADLLTAAVARQITRLKQEGINALAIDITQNGGGSLWLDPVARMMTPIKLRAPRMSFTRTENWRSLIQSNLEAVESDLANPSVTADDRAALETAKETLTRAVAEAGESCDRSGVWTGKAPACALLSSPLLYATGVFDYAAPGRFAALNSSAALFFSSLYDYQEGLWTGPLYVVMDEGSASASEHFATLLKDNGAAVLIGEPTYGAGCGWMSGGDQAVTLEQSRADLHVPDCVWTRRDGSNELAGIEPDILVPWRFYDNPLQKVRRLAGVLQTLDIKGWSPAAAPPATGKLP